MGYYTRYALKFEHINGDPVSIWLEIKILKEDTSYGNDWLSRVTDGSEPMKWYDNEVDMKAVSAKYPDVLFTLTGYGDEQDDIWRKYFMGGKVQLAKSHIVFDEFDVKKLK